MNIKKLKENAVIPTYGSEYAAGADLYAAIDNPVTIAPGATEFIGTGLAMEIPMGYAGFVYARSGLSCKEGLAPANKVGRGASPRHRDFLCQWRAARGYPPAGRCALCGSVLP